MPMIDLTNVRGSAGIEPDGDRAFHVWMLIHQILEGNWAGGGKIVYYQQIRGLVADDPAVGE